MSKQLVYKATFSNHRTLLVSQNKSGKLSYEYFHSLTREEIHVSYLNLNIPLPDSFSELWDGDSPRTYQPKEVMDKILLSNKGFVDFLATPFGTDVEKTTFVSKRM